jgi:hypothetical protein
MNGIQIEIKSFDPDDNLIDLRIRASNGRFAGMAELYIIRGELSKVADAFRGYPENIEDRRNVELGNFDPAVGGGGVRIQLRADKTGHVTLKVELRTDPFLTDPRNNYGQSETAEFLVPIEPAAIDDFVSSIEKMPLGVSKVATLRMDFNREI